MSGAKDYSSAGRKLFPNSPFLSFTASPPNTRLSRRRRRAKKKPEFLAVSRGQLSELPFAAALAVSTGQRHRRMKASTSAGTSGRGVFAASGALVTARPKNVAPIHFFFGGGATFLWATIVTVWPATRITWPKVTRFANACGSFTGASRPIMRSPDAVAM